METPGWTGVPAGDCPLTMTDTKNRIGKVHFILENTSFHARRPTKKAAHPDSLIFILIVFSLINIDSLILRILHTIADPEFFCFTRCQLQFPGEDTRIAIHGSTVMLQQLALYILIGA